MVMRRLAMCLVVVLLCFWSTPTPTSPQNASPTFDAGPPLRPVTLPRSLSLGAAVAAGPLHTDPRYARALARELGVVTTENALKFGPLRPSRAAYRFDDADAIVAFAEASGLRVRGHTL